uniref:integrase family protein n=1 Tax=uncultured Ruegeria sp. TaxID=259304 RepID=UPI002613E82E
MTDQTNVVRLDQHRPPEHKTRHRAKRVKLTQNRVESARPGKTRRRIADADVIGLHLVVQPSGAKSYVVRGRIGGGRTRPVIDMTLGSTDALTLGEARTRAKIALARMQSGEDPRADRDGEIAVGDLIDLFLNYHRQRRTVTLDKIERCLRRVCAGLTRQPAQTVTKAQWAEAVGRTRKRNSLSAAQADAQWVRAMARWADDEGIAENLPAMRVVSPKASIAEKAEAATRTADRWTLRQEDWRAFWEGTAKLEDPTWRAYFRALALTGLRRSEAALARWKDVDLNTGIWTIPAVHT